MPSPRRWFFAPARAPASPALLVVHTVLVLGVLAGLLHLAFARIAYHWNWQGVWDYRASFARGWWVTLGISAAALVLSTLLGTATALARRSAFLPLRQFAVVYVELIRGTPLLVQILLLFYVVGTALRLENREVAGVLILSLFAGAYLAEIVRGGMDSVPASQLESARAIGLTPRQIHRYVVFPQAFRQMLPGLAGQFVSLVKDSSLLSLIAIEEFSLRAQQVNSNTYSTLESYLPLAVGYLMLTWPLSLLSRALERRFRYET